MVAGIYNLLIEQGTTYTQTFHLKEDDDSIMSLTGYSAELTIKTSYTASSSILTASTTGSYLTLNGELGVITLVVPNTVTSSLSGSAVYTFDITSSGGVISRILEGKVNFSPSTNV